MGVRDNAIPEHESPTRSLALSALRCLPRAGTPFAGDMQMTRRIDVKTGDRYGLLTVIQEVSAYISPSGRTHRRLELQCDCGQVTRTTLAVLRRGDAKSCGCRQRIKHGLTKTPTHRVWIGMRQRCLNPHNAHYSYYGGRGIAVCKRWDSFENFLQDMGERPTGLTLERIDNNGDYEPGNCRWASRREQQRNRRNLWLLTYRGKTQCLTAWADETGISVGGLRHRLSTGWNVAYALEKPLRQGVRPPDVQPVPVDRG